MLSQKEAVNEVLSLYEEMENLKRQNEELFRIMNDNLLREERNREKIDTLTEKFERYGREMLAKQYANTWRDVFASRMENGDIRFDPDSFEEWASRKLDRREIPSHMSREDIFNALRSELHDIYDSEKEEAKKILLEKEAEAKVKAE